MWWGSFCKSCGIELIDVGTYLMILVSISWWWVVFGESNSWISLFVTSWRYFGSVDTMQRGIGNTIQQIGVPIGIGYVQPVVPQNGKDEVAACGVVQA